MLSLDSNTIQIMSSRDSIRKDLIDYAKTYLELENVDLYYTSFISYIINILSILAANQMYYTSTVYREFFLTEAQMQESVYNLAKWIGYNVPTAIPAAADVMFTIPLTFKDNEVRFIIPDGFKIKADDIVYTSFNKLTFKSDQLKINQQYSEMSTNGVYISVINNTAVTVRNVLSGYFYPVVLNSNEQTASFVIPFSQYEQFDSISSVPQDLEIYQFWSMTADKYVGMPGTLTIQNESISAEVFQYPGTTNDDDIVNGVAKENNIGEEILPAEANSLYTMSDIDLKYVMLIGNNKTEFFFGNGIIGKQPNPGWKIHIRMYITRGEEGKVIANSLTDSEKLYYTYIDDIGKTKLLPIRITTTNPSPATGGSDIPSISTIKSRAIANLRSKGRLVSAGDYDEISQIIPDTPLADALPVLKRSDLKVNEIEVFSRLTYGGEICPTRNLTLTINDSTSSIIPDHTIIPWSEPTEQDVNNITNYETFFEMRPEFDYNNVRYYYNVSNVDAIVIPNTTWESAAICYIIPTTCNFLVTGNNLDITLKVINVPDQMDNFSCILNAPEWFENPIEMTPGYITNPVSKLVEFKSQGINFQDIPENIVKFNFQISGMKIDTTSVLLVSSWDCNITLKKNLDSCMMSSMTENPISGLFTIHNIPVIKNSYFREQALKIYTNLTITDDEKIALFRNQFELSVIQRLINNIEINSKRMLTDFINIKFTDATGKLTNMKYNLPDLTVLSDSRITPIINPIKGDSYIVTGYEKTDLTWIQYINKIATYNGTSWQFTTPAINQTVWIADIEKTKVFSGNIWIEPIFDIPLRIEAIINRSSPTDLPSVTIIENVKTALLDYFSPKFGIDKSLDRSEIIKVIRSVSGVTYCKLIKPEIDIRFDYSIPADLDQEDLLDYTPQVVQFVSDTISISVIDTSLS